MRTSRVGYKVNRIKACRITIIFFMLFFYSIVDGWVLGNATADPLDNWHLRASVNKGLWGVAYGNGTFVAVGDEFTDTISANSGTIFTSSDGTNWTNRNSGISDNLFGISWVNGIFVTVGWNTISTSPDGVNWTERYRTPYLTCPFPLYSVTYGNGTFVAVGNLSIFTSIDGINWTHRDPGVIVDLTGVTFGNGIFVAVGPNIILTSSDGINWTIRRNTVGSSEVDIFCDVAFGNGKYVAVGWGGINSLIFTSSDGTNWGPIDIELSDGQFLSLYSIIYWNGLFIAVGVIDVGDTQSAVVFTSLDGVNWVKSNWGGYAGSFEDIVYGNRTFVIVGGSDYSHGAIFQSDPSTSNPLFILNISKSGTGTGTVTSSPAGIKCGSNCTENVKAGTKITLTAKADSNSTFTGWSGGGCSGTGKCVVILNTDIAVSAIFSLNLPTITDISGYSDRIGVSNGKWTGQPSNAPSWASNKYKGDYALESQNDNYYWLINGSGFGENTGTLSFSDSNISVYKTIAWKDSQIKIIPKVPYTFTYNNSVTLTVTNTYQKSTPPKVVSTVGIIKSRGFGQCTWFVAYTRLKNGKSIPPKAYSTTGSINGNYVPQQWDCLTYGSKHVAIIKSSPSKSETTDSSGNRFVTYVFKIGEYNAKWDEAESSFQATFVIKIDKKGKKAIVTNIGSNSGLTGTGYFR